MNTLYVIVKKVNYKAIKDGPNEMEYTYVNLLIRYKTNLESKGIMQRCT